MEDVAVVKVMQTQQAARDNLAQLVLREPVPYKRRNGAAMAVLHDNLTMTETTHADPKLVLPLDHVEVAHNVLRLALLQHLGFILNKSRIHREPHLLDCHQILRERVSCYEYFAKTTTSHSTNIDNTLHPVYFRIYSRHQTLLDPTI